MKLTSKDKIINDSFDEKLCKARQLKTDGHLQAALEFYRKALFLK